MSKDNCHIVDPLERINRFMEIQHERDDKVECGEDIACSGGSILHSIIDEFGGLSMAMGIVNTATSCASRMWPDNEKYQKVVKAFQSGLPLLFTMRQLCVTVKNHIVRNRLPKEGWDIEREMISKILDLESPNDLDWHWYDQCKIDSAMERWLLSRPKTDFIETLGVIDGEFDLIEGHERLESLDKVVGKAYYFYKLKSGQQFTICVERDFLGRINKVRKMCARSYNITAIDMMCTYAYISSLNFNDNIITIRSVENITVSPRKKIDHKVYQLEDSLFHEVKNSIAKKKKRGYALAGLPGTGKTTIVDKIADEIRDVPVFYIPCDSTLKVENVSQVLMMCQMASPCIVVFEDMDSLPLASKNSSFLGVFIDYLDSAKYDAPVIFFATLNEPENVHESLMDRRGRFDQVVLVSPPKSKEHILEVFENIYSREIGTSMDKSLLSDEFYDMAAAGELRHSDFAEIINRVFINDMPLETASFTKVLCDICETQKLINKFKERKKNSTVDDYDCLDKECDDRPMECCTAAC